MQHLFSFAALFGYLALLSVLVVWNAWVEPPENLPRLLPILALGLPLLLVLRGLLRRSRKIYQLAALLAIIYFTLGLTDVAAGDLLYGWIQTIAALIWFIGLLLYLRSTAIRE